MTIPNKCPKCQSDRLTNFTGLRFECGSWFSASGQAMHQSHLCIVSERDALAARVKELEATLRALMVYTKKLENAGDEFVAGAEPSLVDNWNRVLEGRP